MSVPDPVSEPFSLSIAAPEQLSIGSEAKVQITLTNVTDHSITLLEAVPNCDYIAEVHNEKGNLAAETEYKRQLKCDGKSTEARNILVTLKPQESRQQEILLTRLYDLNHPGKYLVQVARKIPKELGQGTVKSNTVTITVTG